jgi:hypothetical protein
MPRGPAQLTIERLLDGNSELTTKEVAELAGVSRQAAQKQLKALVKQGRLTVRGKARAARYVPAERVDALWKKVAQLGHELSTGPLPSMHAQAQFPITNPRPTAPGRRLTIPPPRSTAPMFELPVDDSPKRQRIAVLPFGAQFRLSARLLLTEVDCDEVTLDFEGVAELGEEFLEEVLHVWAEAHPQVAIQIVNLAPPLVERLQRFRAS